MSPEILQFKIKIHIQFKNDQKVRNKTSGILLYWLCCVIWMEVLYCLFMSEFSHSFILNTIIMLKRNLNSLVACVGRYILCVWTDLFLCYIRFNASNMLNRIRNRRVVFVCDSIGRNQWESLICMLVEVVLDKLQIYEVNGSPISKNRGFLSFRFKEFNCTVEYYTTPFLVLQGCPPKGSPPEVRITLKLDLVD